MGKITDFFAKLIRNKKNEPQSDIQEETAAEQKTAQPVLHESQSTEKDDLLKKAKKEKEALEDELDDKNHSLKIANDKLESVRKEFESLKNTHRELESDFTAKKQELEKIRQENELALNDLEIKTKSIDIVNEILTAQKADDRDAETIREKAEKIFDFVTNRVCEDFRNATDLSKEHFDAIQDGIYRWGNLQLKTWLNGKIVIAFVGEFSAGKTSIVNRILTRDDDRANFKLPVHAKPTTAVATYISYGQETRVQFTDAFGNLKNLSFGTFSQFSKSVLEKIHLAQIVTHFVIKYDNQNLAKLSILDTPGFSSNDREDERRTTEVIKEADGLFWVIDMNMGEINERSLKIIREHMADLPLYIVLNKADTRSPNERDVMENRVRKTMEKNNIQVREYIEFSKNEPLDNITRVISGIASRREEGDIISQIDTVIINCIIEYDGQSSDIRKNIREIQERINKNESITNSFNEKSNAMIDAINRNRDELISEKMIGSTLFGSGNKLKNPEGFWKLFDERTELNNKIMELYNEFSNACWELMDDYHNKSACDSALENIKGYIQTLTKLKSDFARIRGE